MSDEIILSLLKEVREGQKSHEIKQAKLIERFDSMHNVLEKNTKDLEYHVKRTNLLEDLHRDNQRKIEINEELLKGNRDKEEPGLIKRVEALEKPAKFNKELVKRIAKITGFISSVGGAALLILKALGKL